MKVLWRNGKEEKSIKLLENMTWYFKNHYATYSLLDIGENECILLSNYTSNTKTDTIQSFVFYDMRNDIWAQMEDYTHGDSERKTIVGNKKAIFAVFDQDQIIRIYDSIDNTISEIKTNINPNTVVDWKFIDEDNYIAIYTHDSMFEIYDISKAKLVYYYMGNAISYRGHFSFHIDNQKRRAFFILNDSHICLCLDASSWTELAIAEDAYGFDDMNDRIYFYKYDKVFYRQIPTLEDMICIGRKMIE